MAPLRLVHPRDLAAWRRDGVLFSTTSDQAAKLFDVLMYQMFAITEDDHHGGIEGTFEHLIAADPNFIITRVLRALEAFACHAWRDRRALVEETASLVREAEAAPDVTDLERRHLRALEKYVIGRHREACDIWQDLLSLYPKDLLGLRQIFDYGIMAGDAGRMRAAFITVRPHYKPSDPYFAFVLSRLGFSLEETGDVALGRQMTESALAAQPKDAWAAHTMAHVLDSIGRGGEAASFLLGTVKEWSAAAPLACHNFWHAALGHVELGHFKEATALYEAEILPRVLKSTSLFPLSDAASLLFRLEMEGRTVPAEGWRALAEVGRQNRMSNHRLVGYYDAVTALCFARVSSDPQAPREMASLFQELRDDVNEFSSGSEDLAVMHRDVGFNVVCAAQKFVSGDFTAAAGLLYPCRFDLVRLGGSHAQRDVFNQMLCRALMNSQDELDWRRCQALLEERKLAKGSEGVTGRLWSALTGTRAT